MIILLNGPSSAGKSSIAESLCDLSKDPYFLFSVDHIVNGSLPIRIDFENKKDFQLFESAVSGFNRALREFAKSCEFIIVDHVLHRSSCLKEIANSLNEFDVFFVGIKARLDVLEAREKTRADRKQGTAKSQIDFLNTIEHDLTIYSDEMTIEELALKILSELRPGIALSRYL